jgi:hypothetical protein
MYCLASSQPTVELFRLQSVKKWSVPKFEVWAKRFH